MSLVNHLGCFILKKVLDPETQTVVIQQFSRPWNDATYWPLYNKAKEDYYSSVQRYQHRQALWSFLLTHIDADVDHLIKLHVDIPKKLWTLALTLTPTLTLTSCGSYCVNQSLNMIHLMYQY